MGFMVVPIVGIGGFQVLEGEDDFVAMNQVWVIRVVGVGQDVILERMPSRMVIEGSGI